MDSRDEQRPIQHELVLSSLTDVDWASFCREVCETSVMRDSGKIGSIGIVVAKAELARFVKKKDMYSNCLAVFMWKRIYAGEDLFMLLIRDIAKIYTGPSK